MLLFIFTIVLAEMKLYCPNKDNYSFDSGATWMGNGWSIHGYGRANGLVSFNMLGGYVEFDMDTSQALGGVNTNFYTVSPDQGNFPHYCDIQACNDNSCPFCMEMDIVETNGNCCSQSTIHTWTNWNGGCDRGGCHSIINTNGDSHVKASFSDSGRMTVTINGQANDGYSPYPSAQSDQTVKETMQSKGALLISSQWTGFVPNPNSCPGGGNLADSNFRVANVRVYGEIVQLNGPAPPLCSGTTTSTSSTPHPPPPGNCADVWQQCGGPGWSGTTCCKGICSCKVVNQWYNQCQPPSGNSCNNQAMDLIEQQTVQE